MDPPDPGPSRAAAPPPGRPSALAAASARLDPPGIAAAQSLAADGAGGAGGRARPRRAVLRHAEIHRLQPADLVAQPRRLLELEVGGGGAHLLLQLGDG